jgi:hypothetical protein
LQSSFCCWSSSTNPSTRKYALRSSTKEPKDLKKELL